MTKLFFIRHGKTEWNLDSRYQGMHGDSPLLASSYAEIHQLGIFLRDTQFTRIYSSPIRRARETAIALMKDLRQPLRLTLMSNFAEFDLGRMEGMKFADVQQTYPDEYDAFRHHPDQYDPTNIQAESFPELIARFGRGVRQVVKTAGQDDNLLVVSHGAALNAGLNGLVGIPLAHLRDRGGLSNTSTTVVETTDQGQTFHIISWNQTDYLMKQLDETDTI